MNSRVKLSEKAHAYLQEKRFAVLATLNEDGTPQLTTMWYLLEDDGTVLMNTKVGRAKERNMRRDPRISVCIEDGYIYVTLSGKVEMIDDPDVRKLSRYEIQKLQEIAGRHAQDGVLLRLHQRNLQVRLLDLRVGVARRARAHRGHLHHPVVQHLEHRTELVRQVVDGRLHVRPGGSGFGMGR